MNNLPIEVCERKLLPDWAIRQGVRRLIVNRLRRLQAKDPEQRSADRRAIVQRAATGPIAQPSPATSTQSSVLPPAFFAHVLGVHKKYSGCLFEPGIEDLDQAEHAMLALYAERARLRDGLRILDLGCGALALWAAQRYPRAHVLAVSSTQPQRETIQAAAAARGLTNLAVQSCDINRFDPGAACFDRIVSVELFERLRNYRALLARIAGWLDDDGALFVQVFAHPYLTYALADAGDDDWLARYFFTGGRMPSENLLAYFQRDLLLRDTWWLSGSHYRDTANAWLARLDAARDTILPILGQTYGDVQAKRRFYRWRLFFMTVAELFGTDCGRQWGVAHSLWTPRPERPT